jgi:hypothetical protein
MQEEDSSDDSDSSSCYSGEDVVTDELVSEDEANKVQPLFHLGFSFGKKRTSELIPPEHELVDPKNAIKDVQIRDVDGLGEESHRHEYIHSKRRRSVEAIASGETPSACFSMDSPPSSPLKSEWDASEITKIVG